MTVAHVGDSRAVLCLRNGKTLKARALTIDHKPNTRNELKRIKAAGGTVRKDSNDVFHRVYFKGKKYPGLNMSRSIGDLLATTVGVSNEPDVYQLGLSADFQFIIVCSDGVWEFITNEEAVRLVAQHGPS
jgi:serine/threonine protein phosphatase PrpC